jgi:hypothetical protein
MVMHARSRGDGKNYRATQQKGTWLRERHKGLENSQFVHSPIFRLPQNESLTRTRVTT